ncbi:MAG: cupin domain-containing protein [Anaerolineales bacterium]
MSSVRVVKLEAVEPIPLPNESWSKMVLTDKTVEGNTSSLGYSVFRPGTELASVSHEVEEVAYVIAGCGELRLEDGVAPFEPHDALYIPPNTWHAVANTGDTDVIMVFGFPYPDYPPTERK